MCCILSHVLEHPLASKVFHGNLWNHHLHNSGWFAISCESPFHPLNVFQIVTLCLRFGVKGEKTTCGCQRHREKIHAWEAVLMLKMHLGVLGYVILKDVTIRWKWRCLDSFLTFQRGIASSVQTLEVSLSFHHSIFSQAMLPFLSTSKGFTKLASTTDCRSQLVRASREQPFQKGCTAAINQCF